MYIRACVNLYFCFFYNKKLRLNTNIYFISKFIFIGTYEWNRNEYLS